MILDQSKGWTSLKGRSHEITQTVPWKNWGVAGKLVSGVWNLALPDFSRISQQYPEFKNEPKPIIFLTLYYFVETQNIEP